MFFNVYRDTIATKKMDSDLFTTGGDYAEYNGGLWPSKDGAWPQAEVGEVYYQSKHLIRWWRFAMVLVVILLLLTLLYSTSVIIPEVWKSWATKDGLQYLGASTSVVRDDLGWPTNDSLAETAMRNQSRVTDLPAPVKSTFTAREPMRSPEEELLAAQKK